MSKKKEELLMEYTRSNDLDNLQKLLKENPNIDVNTQDKEGNTAFMFAVKEDNKSIAQLLVDRGANPYIKNLRDQDIIDVMQEMAGGDINYNYDEMQGVLESYDNIHEASTKSTSAQEELVSNRSRGSSVSSLSSNESTVELAGYNQVSSVNSLLKQLKAMSKAEIEQLRSALPKETLDSLLGDKAIVEAKARPLSVQAGSPITVAKAEVAPKAFKIANVGNGQQNLKPRTAEVNATGVDATTVLPSFTEAKKAPLQQVTNDDIIQPLNLADYNISSAKEIVNNNLIARALQHGNLETASTMISTVSRPGPPVKDVDIALKDGMIALIRVLPKIKQKAVLAEHNALAAQNEIKDKYKNIRTRLATDPEIATIITTLKPIKGLASQIRADLLKRAREQLCTSTAIKAGYNTEQDEVNAANYESKRTESRNVTILAESIIKDITAVDTNLSKFSILAEMSKELKALDISIRDAMFKGLEANKKKSDLKSNAPAQLTISSAKNCLVTNPQQLSDDTESLITSYKTALSEAKSRNDLSEQVLNETLAGIKLEAYPNEDLWVEAQAESQKQHSLNQMQIEAVISTKHKDEVFKEAQNGVYIDLVPQAIKLHQFNNLLDTDSKQDPKKLDQYIEAALVHHLKRIDPNIKPEALTAAKKDFMAFVNSPDNQAEYRENSVPADLTAKQKEMKIALNALGIKEELVIKAPSITTAPTPTLTNLEKAQKQAVSLANPALLAGLKFVKSSATEQETVSTNTPGRQVSQVLAK